VLRGFILFSGEQFVSPFLAFVAATLIIRLLKKEEYGVLALYLSIHAIGGFFLDFGTEGWLVSEIARARGRGDLGVVKYILVRLAQFELIMGAVLGSLIVLLGTIISPSIPKSVLFWLGLYLFLTGIKKIIVIGFYSHTLYGHQILLNSLEQLFKLSLVAYFLWNRTSSNPVPLSNIVAVYPISLSLAILSISYSGIRRGASLKGIKGSPLPWRYIKEQVSLMVLISGIKRIRDQSPFWFIYFLLGSEGVAVYKVAQRVYSFIPSLVRGLEASIFPLASELASSDREKMELMVTKSMKYSLWMAIPGILVLWRVAPIVFKTLFSSKYLDSVIIFRIFLLGLVFNCILAGLRPLFYALNKLKHLFYVYLLGSSAYFVLLLGLLKIFGTPGAALSHVSYQLIIISLGWYYLRATESKIKVTEFISIDSFDKEVLKRVQKKVSGIFSSFVSLWPISYKHGGKKR
jgi:O-antigen/teichoic acid export membrane protein